MKKTLLFLCLLMLKTGYSQDAGWTLVQAGEDIYNGQLNADWPGRWDIESLDMKEVPGGFLTCGYYNDQTFDSTDNNPYDLTNKYGGYLAKYDNDGVLQWIVRTEKTEFEERNIIMSIATDSQNNIYIVGTSGGTLYDTTGNSQAVASWNPGTSAFLIKLNQYGQFVWKTIIIGADPKRVAVDNSDNVLVCGSFWGQDSAQMIFNDQYVGVFTDITNQEVNYYLAKYNADGMPLWDAGIYIDAVNSEFLEGITFDSNNNIYLNGTYEMDLKVYDADEEGFIQRTWSGYYGGSMFFAKYTANGDAQWIVNSNDSKLSEIITNADGSHYLTGTNTVYNGNGSHSMGNADGTTTSQNTYGPFYFAKISPEGNWEWVTGSTGTDRGGALEMIKYDDKLSVMGYLGGWDTTTVSGSIHGNENSTEITIDSGDVFLATYDLSGNLLNVSKSGNNGNEHALQSTSGFIKGADDTFYVQRNLWFYISSGPQSFYSQSISPIIGTDASITKFKESMGVPLFINGNILNSPKLQITPNPTENEFKVTLGDVYSEVDLTIFDLTGKTIFNRTFSNVNEVSAGIKSESGIYFVKVNVDGATHWLKIIKQ